VSVDEAVRRAVGERAELLEAVRLRRPKAWGALAAAGVIAFRDLHERAPTEAERRAIWAALWQRATADRP
jgi:hypothetical protein